MKKPGKKPIPTKYILTFLCVICAGFVLLTMINSNIARPLREMASEVILPIQKGMNQIGSWFSDKSDMLKEMADLQTAILENRDITNDEALAKHAEWAEEIKAKYNNITAENIEGIIKAEIGILNIHASIPPSFFAIALFLSLL